MAGVGGSPDPAVTFVFKAIVEGCRRISRTSGNYFTNVKTVRTPNWSEDEHANMVGPERPSLWLWHWGVFPFADADSPAERFRTLRVAVQGYVDAHKEDTLFEGSLALFDDVDHMIFSNVQQNFPGSTLAPNTWGISSRLVSSTMIDLAAVGMQNMGCFRAAWDIDYRTPR